MTTLLKQFSPHGLEPFDLLFKNFFDTASSFSPLEDSNPKYPIDIYENSNGLTFDIAIVGVEESDINIEIVDGNTLYISYEKDDQPIENVKYIHQGIAKRSFKFGWRISSKFDMSSIDASAENGLLKIEIPHAEESKPKKIEIKNRKSIGTGKKK